MLRLCLCVHASDILSNFVRSTKSSDLLGIQFLLCFPCLKSDCDCDCDCVVCVCHCCCLYFQFSRSEVYSWYVLYSFRKRTDSRLDPIEDVFTPKHSYFLSVTQDFLFFFHVYSFHFALSLLFRFSLFIFHHFPFFCILSISKSVCVYFQNYFLFFRISIRSFFQVNIWV